MPDQNGMERSRYMELRRMQIQRMQYGVAVEQAELEIEEYMDKIARAGERIRQTQEQIAVTDGKIEAAKAAAREVKEHGGSS